MTRNSARVSPSRGRSHGVSPARGHSHMHRNCRRTCCVPLPARVFWPLWVWSWCWKGSAARPPPPLSPRWYLSTVYLPSPAHYVHMVTSLSTAACCAGCGPGSCGVQAQNEVGRACSSRGAHGQLLRLGSRWQDAEDFCPHIGCKGLLSTTLDAKDFSPSHCS